MNISKFFSKNISKLSIFLPLLLGQKEGTAIIIMLLLLIYLQRSNTFKNIYTKIFSKNDKKENIQKEKVVNVKVNKIYDNIDDVRTEIIYNNEEEEELEYVSKGNKNIIDKENKDDDDKYIKDDKEKIVENKCEVKKESINEILNKKNKKNIKSTFDHLEFTPYGNERKVIKKKYTDKPENYDFSVNVNQAICSTPIFNLRTYNNINFYFNFLIHNYDSTKIHNLIMCKDIHKWMSSSSLTDQDITNELVPIYFCLKRKDKVDVYEYLKIFIHNGEDGKIAFVQKGNDYIIIEKHINELVEKEIIFDLLDGKLYTNYNLYSNEGVCDFLDKFLSLVLISENNIGEQIKLDIENYYENKSTYEYFMNTINADSTCFNTTI